MIYLPLMVTVPLLTGMPTDCLLTLSVPARPFCPLQPLRLKLVQLDENLIRNEGTALERANWLKTRKEIYEQLYPDTRQYVAGGKGKEKAKNTSAESAFVFDTSKKTGKSKRTIYVDIQIANDLTETTKQLIEDTPIEDKKTDLLESTSASRPILPTATWIAKLIC